MPQRFHFAPFHVQQTELENRPIQGVGPALLAPSDTFLTNKFGQCPQLVICFALADRASFLLWAFVAEEVDGVLHRPQLGAALFLQGSTHFPLFSQELCSFLSKPSLPSFLFRPARCTPCFA